VTYSELPTTEINNAASDTMHATKLASKLSITDSILCCQTNTRHNMLNGDGSQSDDVQQPVQLISGRFAHAPNSRSVEIRAPVNSRGNIHSKLDGKSAPPAPSEHNSAWPSLRAVAEQQHVPFEARHVLSPLWYSIL